MDNNLEGLEGLESKMEDKGISQNNILFDILLIEAERIKNLRIKEIDLYYIHPISGEYTLIGEAYKNQVGAFRDQIFQRKKTRFFITFVNTFEQEDKLKPVALKIARHFARIMSYGNTVEGYSQADIVNHSGVHKKYVGSGLNQLLELDVLRYRTIKGRRKYIVNPTIYFKGTTNGLFKVVSEYNTYPTFTENQEVNPYKKK